MAAWHGLPVNKKVNSCVIQRRWSALVENS